MSWYLKLWLGFYLASISNANIHCTGTGGNSVGWLSEEALGNQRSVLTNRRKEISSLYSFHSSWQPCQLLLCDTSPTLPTMSGGLLGTAMLRVPSAAMRCWAKENDDHGGGLKVSHSFICSSFHSSTPASWVSSMLLAFQPGNEMYKFLPLRGSWSLMTQVAKHPWCNISSCFERAWHSILPCPGEEKLTALCFCGCQILCCYSFPFCAPKLSSWAINK